MSKDENDSSKLDHLPAVLDSKDLVAYDQSPTSQDPLTRYMKEVNRYPLLSIEQERALTKALQETGDLDIARKLVVHNLRLVVKIAMEYRSAWQNIMDLIQEGNIGLMKAVSNYNPEKGAKLSYYSSWWIRSYILKFILDNFHLVKIGTTNEQKKVFFNLMKEKARLEAQGIKPDTKLLAENMGVSEKTVITMDQRLGASGGEVSIDAPGSHDDSSNFSALSNMIADESEGPAEQAELSNDLKLLQDHLKDYLKGLKDRDRDIFTKRLLQDIPPSLQEIADEYGVSRERIRQIEERLLKNFKVYMADYIR